jgi:hypothetical protein
MHTKFWLHNLKRRNHSEDIKSEKIIEADLKYIGFRDVHYLRLQQDWNTQRILADTVMNLHAP